MTKKEILFEVLHIAGFGALVLLGMYAWFRIWYAPPIPPGANRTHFQ